MVGYPLRFNNTFRSVKEKISDGSVGDIENAQATYISSGLFFHRADGHSPVPVPDWWFTSSLTGGGVLIDLGSHMINLFRWYFGEIMDIRSYLGHRFNMNFEDSAMCLIKFESGTVAAVNVGWFSQETYLRIDLLGSVKHVSAENLLPGGLSNAIRMLATGSSKFRQPHLEELQHFVNCLINDLSPSPSGHDGLKDLEAINLAYKNEVHPE